MMMKQIINAVLFLTTTYAAQGQGAEIFSPDGKAIKGYDVVAFFTEMKPVMGTDSLAYTYKGAQWLFSSRQNMETFKADPARYTPQYGGYCAYGMAKGHKAPTETGTWTLVDGKLYLNYSQEVKGLWMKDQPGMIEKADTQWPTIKDKN